MPGKSFGKMIRGKMIKRLEAYYASGNISRIIMSRIIIKYINVPAEPE
jgi:hypothetical protein